MTFGVEPALGESKAGKSWSCSTRLPFAAFDACVAISLLKPLFTASSLMDFFASVATAGVSSFAFETFDLVVDFGTSGVTGRGIAGEKGRAGDLNGVADLAWGPGVDLPSPIGEGCAWLTPSPGGTEGVNIPLGNNATCASRDATSLSATRASTDVDASSRGSRSSSRTRIYVSRHELKISTG